MPDNPGVCRGAGGSSSAIVSGVSISVGPVEVVSVTGWNGAGKSTLLKAVTGRLPVIAGTVTFKDRDVTNWRGHLLARMGLGFVPQTKDAFDTLTVTENLEMGGYLLTKPQLAARIDKVMSTFPALANMRSRTAPDWAYILAPGRVEIAGAASEILGRPDIGEVFLGQSGTGFPAAQFLLDRPRAMSIPRCIQLWVESHDRDGRSRRPRLP
jgi:ABC-type lipopolysaccharide export system ATPase subunit